MYKARKERSKHDLSTSLKRFKGADGEMMAYEERKNEGGKKAFNHSSSQ
jgi:hypothetical protein